MSGVAGAILSHYGADRTFSVPILTMHALSQNPDDAASTWRLIPRLPFELSALPHGLYKFMNLNVVSYALPALIAMGYAKHVFDRSCNPAANLLRDCVSGTALKKLERIQPSGGGFLEAVPLTGFVAMSLSAAGLPDHPVTRRCVQFLRNSQRPDGAWPIDSNLSTWLTTLSVNALAAGGGISSILDEPRRLAIHKWLIASQFRTAHPYTNSPPGGWGWTDLPGAVPDADDTAGVLCALKALGFKREETAEAAEAGIRWLLHLQNSDGGIPTFCRGWGRLHFDQSSPDITAHTVKAFSIWKDEMPSALKVEIEASAVECINFLSDRQNPDGSWTPLWFGSDDAPDCENRVFGTSQVLNSICGSHWTSEIFDRNAGRAVKYLLDSQNHDGGWGGSKGVKSSVEETALAVSALSGQCGGNAPNPEAVSRGLDWLIKVSDDRVELPSSPIGLYFSSLWYHEKLYPLIFSVSALQKAERYFSRP